MKLASALMLAASAAALAIDTEDSQNGFIKLPVQRYTGNSYEESSIDNEAVLEKRAGSAVMTLSNQRVYYDTVLKIGSNQQSVRVIVDTGSSDLWIPSSDVVCSYLGPFSSSSNDVDNESMARPMIVDFEDLLDDVEAQTKTDNDQLDKRATSTLWLLPSASASGSGSFGTGCTLFGSFDQSQSSSFKVNLSAPLFSIRYADRTFATGFWGTDTVGFGNVNVTNLSIAIANRTSSQVGVLGIGLPGLETTNVGSTVSYSSAYQYENLPMRLKSTGIINTNAYSLFLNKAGSLTGTVLFGAVDHAKYSGSLQLLPVLRLALQGRDLAPQRLQIVLSGVLIHGNQQNVSISSAPITALLDSGTTYSYFPSNVVNNIVNLLGAQISPASSIYQVSCNYINDGYNVTFSFSGVTIDVPLSSWILKSRDTCYLTIFSLGSSSSTSPSVILGDNFLQSAYVVYDLENYQIALAPVVYTDQEDIEVISSTIPLAVTAAGYSSTSTAYYVSDLMSATSRLATSRKAAGNPQYTRASPLWTFFGLVMSIFVL